MVKSFLDFPNLYLLWQRPFIKQKIRILNEYVTADFNGPVLDLGCGPGTNSFLFRTCDYTGIDLSSSYIEYASSQLTHNRHQFFVADCRTLPPNIGGPYSMVISNSLFHHLDDSGVAATLQQVKNVLASDGTFHLIDMYLTETPGGIANYLAKKDRGPYARTLKHLTSLVQDSFEFVASPLFVLRFFGMDLWNMVHFVLKKPESSSV